VSQKEDETSSPCCRPASSYLLDLKLRHCPHYSSPSIPPRIASPYAIGRQGAPAFDRDISPRPHSSYYSTARLPARTPGVLGHQTVLLVLFALDPRSSFSFLLVLLHARWFFSVVTPLRVCTIVLRFDALGRYLGSKVCSNVWILGHYMTVWSVELLTCIPCVSSSISGRGCRVHRVQFRLGIFLPYLLVKSSLRGSFVFGKAISLVLFSSLIRLVITPARPVPPLSLMHSFLLSPNTQRMLRHCETTRLQASRYLSTVHLLLCYCLTVMYVASSCIISIAVPGASAQLEYP
jgi:hypothetical protein